MLQEHPSLLLQPTTLLKQATALRMVKQQIQVGFNLSTIKTFNVSKDFEYNNILSKVF